MCHFQDVHVACHHELLNFDSAEQESHTCGYGTPKPRKGEGQRCLFHSCCLLRREIVFECPEYEAKGGRCEDPFAETVFVPLKTELTESTFSGRFLPWWRKVFWPENEPGWPVKVYLEDDPPKDEDTPKDGSEGFKLEVVSSWGRIFHRLGGWKSHCYQGKSSVCS
ncbi:hypothetical protein F4821DRAFT_274972 [Hypoxylon rubiginosum]|uniref:Uncharacterized protein n=1 Tax=Hypoxylon rubiginosum TaxID=110542 RepID=A0ACC0CLT4_9PEZI|nr:hypothetical protein F4821DRAFT_274972 [Hypoxylon rubiginosum]